MVSKSAMANESAVYSQRQAGALVGHRLLGTIGMLASPFMLLASVAGGLQNNQSRLGAFLGLIFVVGWFSNVVGMWQLRATGYRLAGRIVLGLELVGISLASLQQIFDTVQPGSTSVLYTVADIAWPLSMLTLLLGIGTGTIVARVFQGWMRFLPLFCGLWLPPSIILINTVGNNVGQVYGGVHIMIGWLLLGYAVRNGGRTSAAN